jgi:hypothetical protein
MRPSVFPEELDKAAGNYMATLADKRPEGLFLFSASIQESAEGLTDDEAAKVVDVVVGLLGKEMSRKPIEFGGKKFPGLDVTHRGNSGNVIRSVVVRSRTRMYTVSVSGRGHRESPLLVGPARQAQRLGLPDEKLADLAGRLRRAAPEVIAAGGRGRSNWKTALAG